MEDNDTEEEELSEDESDPEDESRGTFQGLGPVLIDLDRMGS
jgi:hypothetical protein